MDKSNSMLGRPTDKEHYHIYKLFGQQSGSIMDHCETMEEFSEEDIWGGVNDAEPKQVGLQETGCTVVPVCRSMGGKEGSSNTSRRSVKIPRKESCQEENSRSRMRQQSAPVSIPDWSQMVWEEKKNENYWRSQGVVDDNYNSEGRDFERIPPHELVARQLAQSQITSFSVYEGIGRTLKGRDLSQVYDELWNVFDLPLLEVEAAHSHNRHLSVVDSHRFRRPQKLCMIQLFYATRHHLQGFWKPCNSLPVINFREGRQILQLIRKSKRQ